MNEYQALMNKLTAVSYTMPGYTELQEGYNKGGGTTTPTTPTLEGRAYFRSVVLGWDRQYNLTNFDHYEIQVSAEQINWYALGPGGNNDTDWRIGGEGGDTDWPVESYHHTNIPPTGNGTTRILYYRVRRVTKASVASAWSNVVSVEMTLLGEWDLQQGIITAAKIAAQAVLEEALAAGAVTETKIGDDSVSTAKLQAAAVIAAKIAAGAVITEKLSVIARDYINNVTQTGVLKGWGGVTEEGGGSAGIMSVVGVAGPDGTTGKVLRMTNNGNQHIRTKTFPVNHNAIYRVTVALKKSANDGTMYFGLSAFGASTEGSQGGSIGQGDKLIIPYNATTRTASAELINFYFYGNTPVASWFECTSYIVGANRSVDDCPAAKNVQYIAKLKSDTTHVAIRILNWENPDVRTLDTYAPVVIEIGAGQIVTQNIVAEAVTAAKMAAGAVITEKLAAAAVTADKIDTAALQAQFANIGYSLTIGYAGTGTPSSPDEGDRRIYLDDDEILFQIYTKSAWSTERQIVLGGVDGNGNFRPFLGCRGLLHDIGDAPTLDPIPSRSHHLFKWNNNAQDQHGVDPWSVTAGAFAYSTTKWEGTHSLHPTSNLLAWYMAYWAIGNSVTGCFMFRVNDTQAVGHAVLEWGSDDANYGILVEYLSTKKMKLTVQKNVDISSVESGVLSTGVWHFIGVTYDSATNTAYLRVDNNTFSFFPTGTWGSPDQRYFQLSLYGGGSYDRYLDDLLLSHDTAMDPDLFFQHVNRGVAWTAKYFAADLLLKPKPGGRVVIDDSDAEPSGGTWHKIENPSTGWITSKTSGWTADQFDPGGLEVDFSSLVPAGAKAVKVCIMQITTLSSVFYRRAGDTNVSNTPAASSEYSHRILYADYLNECTIWLSSDGKAEFAVLNVNVDLYIPYPTAYLL